MGRDAWSHVSDTSSGRGLSERALDWHLNDLSQSIVDDAVDEWHKRLQSCVNEKEGHFEHLLQYFGLSADWLCG